MFIVSNHSFLKAECCHQLLTGNIDWGKMCFVFKINFVLLPRAVVLEHTVSIKHSFCLLWSLIWQFIFTRFYWAESPNYAFNIVSNAYRKFLSMYVACFGKQSSSINRILFPFLFVVEYLFPSLLFPVNLFKICYKISVIGSQYHRLAINCFLLSRFLLCISFFSHALASGTYCLLLVPYRDSCAPYYYWLRYIKITWMTVLAVRLAFSRFCVCVLRLCFGL